MGAFSRPRGVQVWVTKSPEVVVGSELVQVLTTEAWALIWRQGSESNNLYIVPK